MAPVTCSANPLQRTTGCGGYFGKRTSLAESRHMRNVEAFAEEMIFTF